jgi:Arc/MetJ-type ribon-helix-helix transcriptional regulator
VDLQSTTVDEGTEHRIAGLIRFISEGDDSEYIRRSLKDLEAQAGIEKATLATLRQQAERPIELPTPEEVTRSIDILEKVMAADPVLAREQLGRLFEGGRLMLTPQDGRTYLAKGPAGPRSAPHHALRRRKDRRRG